MKKKRKIKTRKVTLVIPESAYQFFKQATVLANQAAIATGEGLKKVSDTMREAMIRGLVAWREINQEATKRLKEKARKEMKELSRKK